MPTDAPAGDPALTQQLAELQAKVTQLQASLAKSAPPTTAAPMSGMPAATPPAVLPVAMGMGKMKPGGRHGMKAGAAPAPPMAGMEMMGMSPMGGGSPAAISQSALPGFLGASHLYHIGATGFFLDHPQHIALTLEQQAGLN